MKNNLEFGVTGKEMEMYVKLKGTNCEAGDQYNKYVNYPWTVKKIKIE